jgi:hypothetical protein
MQSGVVAKQLHISRQEVKNMADAGELAYRIRKRGTQEWRYYDPEQVKRIARERGISNA